MYDVDSLFTNIALKETIDYILEETYFNRMMKVICSKLIFKRLLYKLTTECTFKFNRKFFRQIDSCSMNGPLSVTLWDIHMTGSKINAFKHEKPLFYTRFLDDIPVRQRKKSTISFNKYSNQYHPKINLTIKVNLCKFLDT